MARTAERLAQTALSASVLNRVTTAGGTLQITEIYLTNNGTAERTVDIHHGGTASTNAIMRGIILPAGGSVVLQDLKIVVTSSLSLAAKQDAGTDVILTAFGIREV